jgi:hypothetical protein
MALWVLLPGCGGGFYEPCEAADDCVDVAPSEATAECVEKEGGGFCSWSCTTDADCDGDQDDRYDFVCAPFESNPGTYCFPACQDDECPGGYTCRSTGGGDENEKVCFPA